MRASRLVTGVGRHGRECDAQPLECGSREGRCACVEVQHGGVELRGGAGRRHRPCIRTQADRSLGIRTQCAATRKNGYAVRVCGVDESTQTCASRRPREEVLVNCHHDSNCAGIWITTDP